MSEEQIEESIGAFEKTLEKKILSFLDDFSKVKFFIKGTMSIEDWTCHNNIEMTETDEGIQIKRKP